jgi:hypothetical protein
MHYANLIITLISFIGVLLIIQPPFLFGGVISEGSFFYFVVLLSAFTGSFSMIYLHALKGKCHEMVVLQHNYFVQAFTSYLIYMGTQKNEEEYF